MSQAADYQPTRVRCAAVGEELVQQNTKGPHVGLGGVYVVYKGLRRGPLHRELDAGPSQIEVILQKEDEWVSEGVGV